MTSRYLVTTSDERTWKFDRPVLFLGEWCRTYQRRSVWQGMDAVVAEPYGLTAHEKDRDLAYVHGLVDQLLPELADALNALHGTRHGVRYWNMLVGFWLQYYVAVAFNRYVTVERALERHATSGTSVLRAGLYPLVVQNSAGFIRACNDPGFNHAFYGSVVQFRGFPIIEDIGAEVASSPDIDGRLAPKPPLTVRLKRSLLAAARRIGPAFSRDDDAFVINSYLPPVQEAGLQLTLRQWPQFWESPEPVQAAPSTGVRSRLTINSSGSGFDDFVRRQIPHVLPACFVEGYPLLVEQADRIRWPRRPRFILTSNNFTTDEVFKVWAASCVERGVPYFIGQHGANYGTLRGHLHCPEIQTCDTFLTWGWGAKDPKIVPAFAFTVSGRRSKRLRNADDGGVLLVELPLQWQRTPWDSYADFCVYQEEQFRFTEALPEAIRGRLTVRLHRDFQELGWSDDLRWNDRCPGIRIDPGDRPIRHLIAENRLTIYSYDSTGLLEALALNLPVMCFWNEGVAHTAPDARPFYERLAGAGILHSTPEGAAGAVTQHWNDIGRWWHSRDTQDTRRAFSDRFARLERRPVRAVRRLLLAGARDLTRKAVADPLLQTGSQENR